jgi:prophage regulatory protein
MVPDNLTPDRYQLWRVPEVVRRTGFGRSTIYAMMKDGRFPQARAVGGSVAWRSSEIMDWMEGLPTVVPRSAPAAKPPK